MLRLLTAVAAQGSGRHHYRPRVLDGQYSLGELKPLGELHMREFLANDMSRLVKAFGSKSCRQ